jgi:5-methylcytosine-specific restriction endonuclease McrA
VLNPGRAVKASRVPSRPLPAIAADMPRTEAEPNPLVWFELTAQVKAEEDTCWLCGEPIDFDAPPRTSRSFSVDHIRPKSRYPELRYVRSNLRAAHYGCNSRKKDHDDPEPEVTSRVW